MKKIIFKLLFIISAFLILNSTFLIRNCQSQWVQMSNGMGANTFVSSFISSGSNIFAGTYGNGIYTTTNYGGMWSTANNGLTYQNISALLKSGSNIYAGTFGDGVFRSNNNGGNWIAVNSNLLNLAVTALASSGNNILAGTGVGISLSTNSGEVWSTILTGNNINTLLTNENNIFAGTNNNGIFLSTNNGENWTVANNGFPTGTSVITLALSGTNIFAGTGNGVYLSTNNGGNWISKGLTNIVVRDLTVNGIYIFAATEGGGAVYISTNNGANWIIKNQGMENLIHFAFSLFVADNFIFAGMYNASVWRRPLSDILGIKQISELVPAAYSLGQNYPNPFNPVTRIRYALPRAGVVKLVVYDIMGREVEMLVNERQAAGSYEAVWDGTRFASGVYFYRLTAEGYGETKRMTLIK
jgi:hypothetical protein